MKNIIENAKGKKQIAQKRSIESRRNKDMSEYSPEYRVSLSEWLLERFNSKMYNYYGFYKKIGISRDTFKTRLLAGKLKDSDINKILTIVSPPKF